MKNVLFILLFVAQHTFAQQPKTYINDPLNVKQYTLANGLTILISQNSAEPRIQAVVAVKAGGKNDPSYATGLAHYLEHMLFKGTDKFGTTDFEKEAPYLAKIEDAYERYRKTKNVQLRKIIYREIDSLSGLAAKISIANEYDKVMSGIGGVGVNAFTSFEQTVYFEQIPSNQLSNWVTIQAERFRNPQMRIFHTELEAVYEEKNISLDDDANQVYELYYATLFKNHTYGKQTIIGTVDHLKNPSIKAIKEYYAKYYVPNNMCVVLSGDVNPDEAFEKIKSAFDNYKPSPVLPYTFKPELPISKPIIKKVIGADPANLVLGFRTGGALTTDALYNRLIAYILFNQSAGLVDININQKQKALEAAVSADVMKDYSVLNFYGKPKEGQSLTALMQILLGELEKVKRGEFQDWMIEACVNNLKVQQMNAYQENTSRALNLVQNFSYEKDYQKTVDEFDDMSKITKTQIMDYTKRKFNNNYVAIFKEQDEAKKNIKVTKPEITPVETNANKTSPFIDAIIANKPKPFEPSFVDFDKSIKRIKLANGNEMWYDVNKQNDLFTCTFSFATNSSSNKTLDLALTYFELLSSNKQSNAEIKQEFFKLGCTYEIYANDVNAEIRLNGLNKNFEKSLELFVSWIIDLKSDEAIFKNLIDNEIRSREDIITDKSIIFKSAMQSYALYGKTSPQNYACTNAELKQLKAEDLIITLKNLIQTPYFVKYYGGKAADELLSVINNYKSTFNQQYKSPQVSYRYNSIAENEVLFYNFKGMQQVEFKILSIGDALSAKDIAYNTLLNEYYGGGMGSVVFQTIRESKALAYSTRYTTKKENIKLPNMVTQAYIGTQADKLKEAIPSMFELLNNMQKSPVAFEAAKKAIMQNISSERKLGNDLFNYIYINELQNFKTDINQKIYNEVEKISIDDLNSYFKNKIANKKFKMIVIGDESKIDKKLFEGLGKITTITSTDIFNF